MYSYILHWHNPLIFMTLAKNYYGNIIDEVTDLESILHAIGVGTSNTFSALKSYVSEKIGYVRSLELCFCF